MSDRDLIPLAAVSLATLIASATDLWKFKVYNALTFPTLVLGLVVSAWLGGWEGFLVGLLGAGLGLGLLVVFFAMGGVGAGDVKLMMAVGAWLGPYLTYQVFLASAFAAGLYAVILICSRGGLMALFAEIFLLRSMLGRRGPLGRTPASIEEEVGRPDRRRRLVPFAAMTCLGFFATLTWWGGDLKEIWPPYDRPPTVEAALNLGMGGGR
ncbi:A24 family peptidase [Tundrisphaera lichenicola]|uniref:A24 family peptidase n=1 Tax=Tundrisphaera lichenicola TaxID=2029860 RepID=UPI003EB9B62A